MACATVGGKVFLHQPHHQGVGNDNQISYLNINKQISAVVAGRLAGNKDVLLVGTPSNLQCYDVELNRDLFYKDVNDGVNVCVVGPFGNSEGPLAIVGGNCSIQVRRARLSVCLLGAGRRIRRGRRRLSRGCNGRGATSG